MPGPGGPRGRASFLTEEEKQNSPRITKALVKRVLSYLRPYRKHLALVLCCIAVSSVCSLFPSILTGYMVDVLTGRNLGGWIGAGISTICPLGACSFLRMHFLRRLRPSTTATPRL